jgi:hypothetical protein
MTDVIETAATVVEEDQIVKDTRCRGRSGCSAWLLVTPFVDVVSLTMRVKVLPISIKVVANVRDIFFEEWQLWVRIPHISSDAQWVFVTISYACFFGLRSHRLSETEVIETAATVVEEDQVVKDTSCRGGSASDAWFLVAPLVNVVSLAECLEIGAIAIEVEADVGDILLKERQHRIWITHVGRNTERILVAVR